MKSSRKYLYILAAVAMLSCVQSCQQHEETNILKNTVHLDKNHENGLDTCSVHVASQPFQDLVNIRQPDKRVRARKGHALWIETEGLSLAATDTAVIRSDTYSVTSLFDDELPPLPQGMMNMTAAAAGYRLLPGGEHFRPYAELRMAYDPDKLPKGYTPDDIYTSFYDTATLAWVRLERVGVDTVTHEIVSLTTHFTDFINELLKAPEMPETQGFVPTAMTDLEAVNPLDGLPIVQPPTANNNGTANITYPIDIPAGRGGMQPNLALTYSSTGGSGWLGVGWDIPVSSITLDTRWGVPRYDPKYETEIYLLDGEQLITKNADGEPRPMPHRTNHQTFRVDLGDTVQFYARTGDAHDSIIRHGNSPKNYWWEVVDRNGVTHYYGRYHQTDRSMDIRPDYNVIQAALPSCATYDTVNNILRWKLPTTLCDDHNNIARWVLTESRDLYGNTVRYYYDQATVKNRGAIGRQLYLDSISYTGHDDTDGYYTVVFCRTGNTTNDIPVSCNNGFKEITDQLLNNIYLKCGDSIQTIWHFELENGDSTNYKNRLASITKIDTVEEIGMRGLLDSLCHCIRQDEDEYATASGDKAYIFMPDSVSPLLDTTLIPIDRLLWEKCCIMDTQDLHTNHDGTLYDFVYNNMYHPFHNTDTVKDSLFFALYDSIYYQTYFYDDSAIHWWFWCSGYEIRVDTIRTVVFDSLRIPRHIRPLSEFTTLGYAGSATNFDYYDAPASASLYGEEKTIDLSGSNKNLHGFFLSDPFNKHVATQMRSHATGLGLTTTSAWNVGGAATVGLGPEVWHTNASLGGNYTRSGSSSETQMTLIDLDGDGLSDKVFVRGDSVYFCRQYWYEIDSMFYFDTPEVVKGIHHIMRSSSRSNTFGVQAALGVSAGANWTDTKSTTSTYFADVNGDGFVDLVDDGQVYFNHCEKEGVPVFKRYSDVPMTSPEGEDAEVIAIVDSMAAACGDIIFDGAADGSINCQRVWVLVDTLWVQHNTGQYYTRLNEHSEDTMYRVYEGGDNLKVEVYHREWDCSYHDDSPATDAVRVWIAPRDGEIDITSRIQLQEDISESRRVARHADGVVLSIQKISHISHGQSRFNLGSEDTLLIDRMIDSVDYTMHVDSRRDSVKAGNMIFFRLRSKADRHFDDIYARFTIDYTDSNFFLDKDDWHFDSQEDFVLSGDYYFQAPVNGFYKVYGRRIDSTGNVSVVLEQNNTIVPYWHVGSDTMYTTDMIPASKDDVVRIELRSNNGSPVNWGQVRYSPYIVFVPEEGAERYDSVYHTLDSITLDTTTFSNTDTIKGWLMPHVNFIHYDTIYDVPLYRRLFGPLYKGWGQFAYRSEGLDADQIQIEKLVPPDMMVAGNTNTADSSDLYQKTHTSPDTSRFSQSETMEDFLSNNSDFYSPYSNSSNWVEMTPDVEHWAWVGYGHQNTVGRDTISNSLRTDWFSITPDETVYAQNNPDDSVTCITGQIVVYDDPVPPASHGTPAKAVNKVNRSKSHSWSVGFLGAGTSHSSGGNTIEIEYMDLNGDRYPDIIGTDKVQYSQQWGGVGPVRTLDNALSHGSASHTESHGLSFSASQVTQERTTCSLQQNAFFTMHSEGSGGVSGGGNIGNDEAGGSWVDINGDGLPDFVNPMGEVRLNIGYGFLDAEHWNLEKVRNGKSGAISVGAGLGLAEEEIVTDFLSGVTNISQASIEFGVGVDGSYNQTTHMLIDINGDGLPDKLWRELNDIDSIVNGGDFVKTEVCYNLGAGRFSSPQTLDIGRFHSSASFSESMNLGFTYGFTVWGTFKITLGLNGCPYNAGVIQDYVQLADINADGLPDWVYSINEDEMIVRYNMGGRTNLLKKVTNFNNASFQIEYALSEPSYNQPSRTWLMTKVTTHDTLNSSNGATTTVTEYAYANPHYDRYERTSYGYANVTTIHINPASGSAYRKIDRDYYNNNMLRRGRLKRELIYVNSNKLYIEKIHECTYIDYTHGDTLTVDTLCPSIAYPVVEATITKFYEGGTTPLLVVGERTEYDRYHNVLRYTDLGDTNDTNDGLVVDFHYYTGLANNLIGLRRDYAVTPTGSATAMRRARFEYDLAHGKMTRQVLYNDSDSSVYDFVYDPTYGNLDTAMQPLNDSNQRMTYYYEYDNTVHTYPTRIFNSYGEAMSTSYDYRFGKPLTVTDPTGSTMTYSYDFAGRLTSVNSPMNTSGTPSLVNQYHPMNYYQNGLNPQGYTFNVSPTGHPYTVSKHYDDNGNLITETTVLTNGFGQAIQTKKGLRVGGANMMQVSGRSVVDAYGRTVEQYDPVVEDSSIHRGEYNTNYDVNSLTSTTYDVLDRTKDVTMPLGVTTHTVYGIGNDAGGHRRFYTRIIGPNSDTTHQYSDYDGHQVQVTDANNGITLMQYDNLGQLVSASDPEGFTTSYAYNMLGRMTKRIHPDAGETRYIYDNAGNLLTEINPLGQINYDYTYYRPMHKRYFNMSGNNVTYTYGDSGPETGRLVRIVDGSGMYECKYDKLGNVIDETRTIALPYNSDEVYRFHMGYTYDSWGRIHSMTYPDGEEITYSYQWGGDLHSMHGNKNNNDRTYIREIQYNSFGQKEQVNYGNGTTAQYTYDVLHRLAHLRSYDSLGNLMQKLDYTFDNASNITFIKNSAGVANSLGGGYENNYHYDNLHRLTHSDGGGVAGNYDMDMAYTPSGRIIWKHRNAQSSSVSETVNMFYGYCDENQPHAVRRIFDDESHQLFDLRWDEAGNLGQVSIAKLGDMFEAGRFLFWTEDNRMHAAVDDRYYSYYAYDHSGERRLKLTGDNKLLDVNADLMATYTVLNEPTLYPSAYMVLTNKGYTKHYYAGTERVAARLGGGGLNALQPVVAIDEDLQWRADKLFKQSLEHVNYRVLHENDLDCIMQNEFSKEEFGYWIDDIPRQMKAEVECDHSQLKDMVNSMLDDINHGEEKEVYFYHSDHLGSASWITDFEGMAVQHLQYLPYGEPYVNQHPFGYSERFTFTGKERDEETGYGYFGARYMDHELMTMWLSVDPMSDKYPSISPYAYCAWNPVKLVDPDGREVDDPTKWKNIASVIPESKFVGWQREPYRTTMTNRRKAAGYKDTKPNCNDHARMQLEQVGCSTTGPRDKGNMIPYTEKGGVDMEQTNKAIEYIHKQLDEGIPVFIGVDEGITQDINNGTTDHYLVIVGQGNDDNGNYFLVYDNATAFQEYGTSCENKLYQQSDGRLSGTIELVGGNKQTYTISEVRPTSKKKK